MLILRCTLEQHRLIVPVSITKPTLEFGNFQSIFPQKEYRALVDTGAQRTVLSRSVIAEQSLKRVGHMEFSGLHGSKTHSRYLAGFAFWAKRVAANSSSTDFNTAEQSLYSIEEPYEVVDMEDNINFDLILGFDILKSYSFSYEKDTHSFEIIIKK